MNLTSCFAKTDKYISYLDVIQKGEPDQDIKSMCAGVAALSAATVYELAVRDIFTGFAQSKHKVLHSFTVAFFERINGQIQVSDIEGKYIKKFGERYLKRFKRKLDEKEKEVLKAKKVSIKTAYGNLLTWRHAFVHRQVAPSTFDEVKEAYVLGRNVIECLNNSMHH